MRLSAFAIMMAIPFLALTVATAKADRYCCEGEGRPSFETRDFRVTTDAAIFGCDGHHCQTNAVLPSEISVRARCRNGWCQLRSTSYRNAWILKRCLTPLNEGYENQARDDGAEHEDNNTAYSRRNWQ